MSLRFAKILFVSTIGYLNYENIKLQKPESPKEEFGLKTTIGLKMLTYYATFPISSIIVFTDYFMGSKYRYKRHVVPCSVYGSSTTMKFTDNFKNNIAVE